jgi:hypothetical protein
MSPKEARAFDERLEFSRSPAKIGKRLKPSSLESLTPPATIKHEQKPLNKRRRKTSVVSIPVKSYLRDSDSFGPLESVRTRFCLGLES